LSTRYESTRQRLTLMSRPIIEVENLSKRYRLGQFNAQTMREEVEQLLARFRNKRAGEVDNLPGAKSEFWALKDVSFSVQPGEVVGIIGRNGAGKSTLLKILSRVTEPTSGTAYIRGRVASLLEVGTGFHPELTGRENIYLNGAILGMTRPEIRTKFDQIVTFAEVERFLDTPVKRYSSGMYVRLAFAVAAHLEPEILIVDEVLSVGDAEFQKKCLGKMGEVAEGGRTVLFVSHNMATVNRLCRRCLLLESGHVKMDSDAQSATAQYMASDTGTMAAREWRIPSQRPGDEVARLIAVRVLQDGRVTESVDIRYPISIEMTYENYKDNANLVSALAFFDSNGVHLFAAADLNDPEWSQPRARGLYNSICHVPGNLFAEGIVRVAAEVSTHHPVYQIHFLAFDSVGFQVVDVGQPGSVRGGWGRPIPGVMRPMCEWSTARLQAARQLSTARKSPKLVR
jgi:lipopolysaccharide transport system ATP-binding protein